MKRIAKAAGFAFAMAIFSATVYVTQIKEVNVNYLGESISFRTMASTVSDALKEKNIEIKEGENVSADLYSKLGKSNNIVIEKPVVLAMAEQAVEVQKVEEPKVEEPVAPAPVVEEPKKEEVIEKKPETVKKETKELSFLRI